MPDALDDLFRLQPPFSGTVEPSGEDLLHSENLVHSLLYLWGRLSGAMGRQWGPISSILIGHLSRYRAALDSLARDQAVDDLVEFIGRHEVCRSLVNEHANKFEKRGLQRAPGERDDAVWPWFRQEIADAELDSILSPTVCFHLYIKPSTLVINTESVVRLTLERRGSGAGGHNLLSFLSDKILTVHLIESEHMKVIGENKIRLIVSPTISQISLEFKVKLFKLGKVIGRLLFAQEGMTATIHEFNLRVAKNPDSGEKITLKKGRLELSNLPRPDISLMVKASKKGADAAILLTLIGPDDRLLTKDIVLVDPDKQSAEWLTALEKLNSDRPHDLVLTSVQKQNTLRKIGEEILEFFSSEMRELIHSVLSSRSQGQGKPMCLVTTNESWVPWELTAITTPGEDCAQALPLAVRFGTTRWLINAEGAPPVISSSECVFSGAINNSDSLTYAAEDLECLSRHLGKSRIISFEGTSDQRNLKRLRAAGMWHFALNGQENPDCGEPFVLIMPDDRTWRPEDLLQVLTPKPSKFLFFNSCRSGRMTWKGANRRLSGWPAELISQGNHCIAAPWNRVHDRMAAQFASSFYDALADDLCLGSAACEAWKACWPKNLDPSLTVGGVYFIFGHPYTSINLKGSGAD